MKRKLVGKAPGTTGGIGRKVKPGSGYVSTEKELYTSKEANRVVQVT